jgi:photosystem II stability/assembly factor-like uncharacterized protein
VKTLKSVSLPVLIFSLFLQLPSIKAQSGWILQPSISSMSYSKIKFINSQTGFLIGYSNKIFKTTNSGMTWSDYIVSDSVNELRDIFFVNQTTGFIAGGMVLVPPTSPLYAASIVLKTTDAGNSWIKVYYDTNQNVQKHFSTITFSDQNTGYVGGGLYASGQNYLFKTTDGGNNWTEISYEHLSFQYSMKFQNNSEGVSVLFSKILKTANGGSVWTEIASLGILSDLFFVNNLTGYVCGGEPLFDGSDGSGRSLIMKTTNAGNNWQNVFYRDGEQYNVLSSVYFTDINTGYSVGSSYYFPTGGTLSIILKTTNQGANWGFQASPPGSSLLSIEFLNNSTGFAVGIYGTILKTTDGGGEIISGINSYSNEIPDGYALYQNYPNPFNPSTIIKYEIPNKQQVSIKIYNVLGNEIESLINEVQSAGIYEVTWNAANLPSGIYYYKIHTENYSNSKKMLLVK